MITIVKPNIGWPEFSEIRNLLFKHIPFGVINAEYCNETGYFQFWDISYVPETLKPYVHFNQSTIDKMNEDFNKLI